MLLVMECWSVALASASGDGAAGMAVQSSANINLHLGAMGRSHIGVVFRPFLSLAQFSGSVEDRSARMYVRASMRG